MATRIQMESPAMEMRRRPTQIRRRTSTWAMMTMMKRKMLKASTSKAQTDGFKVSATMPAHGS
jgi:hypothetical protein